MDEIGDAGNNKTEEIDARGNTTRYEYDPVTSKPTAVIDRLDNRTEYTYDGAGRTTSVSAKSVIKNESGEITGYNQEGTASYEYNAYDDLTKITRGDGQAYTMGYDAYRNLTSVNVGDNNLVTYEYKSGGNRLKSMEYANGAKQTIRELTSYNGCAFEYDVRGRRISKQKTDEIKKLSPTIVMVI